MNTLRAVRRLVPALAVMLLAVLSPVAPSLIGIESVPEASAMPNTTIVVTSTEDFANSTLYDNHTCKYTSGAFFFPAADGECTLRRAVLEAAVRPDADRPILIEFDLETSDPHYDSSLGIWEIQIDESFDWDLDRLTVGSTGGSITIDGDSQPGGRSDGPKIMINTNRDDNPLGGVSLTANTDDNVLNNLGFHGGGQLIFSGDGNEFENLWMGIDNAGTGMQLASDDSSQSRRGMARGGIVLTNSAEDNVVRGNAILGAFQRAIVVDGDDNVITENWIGLNGFGVLGQDLECYRDSDYQDDQWYGGDGIWVLGSDNVLTNNVLGGLHRTGTATESPARAFEVDGTDNVITGNQIGYEADGTPVGVCGGGIQLAGDGTIVTDNALYNARIGSDNGLNTLWNSAIITQSLSGSSSSTTAHLTVHSNIIDDGRMASSTEHAYELPGNAVQTNARLFPPGKVTSINGTAVTGTIGDTDPINMVDGDCPGCTIYIYVDDLDDNIETHELLGTAVADANGDWSTTLSRAITTDEGLRTQSQANARGIIGTYGAGMTSRVGEELHLIFVDVVPTDWFADAVAWAAAEGITAGTSETTFSPNDFVTRAQMATFLWRYDGEPATSSHTFTDVPPGIWYDAPVGWMAGEGITQGTSPTTFSPNDFVTRAQIATFLWRYENEPAGSSHSFVDVPSGIWFDEPVGWMAGTGITQGTSATTFSPNATLTRAQAVTFLFRLANL